MKEKIAQRLAELEGWSWEQAVRLQLSKGYYKEAKQILSLLKEEIEKSLLTDGKIGDMWQNWVATDEPSFEDAKKLATTRLKTIAQAQLDKVLKILS